MTRPRRVILAVEVDDDLRAAVGHRTGRARATEAQIRRALEAALFGWIEDVMYEWRNDAARPRDDDSDT
jgi:hypothetical protein